MRDGRYRPEVSLTVQPRERPTSQQAKGRAYALPSRAGEKAASEALQVPPISAVPPPLIGAPSSRQGSTKGFRRPFFLKSGGSIREAKPLACLTTTPFRVPTGRNFRRRVRRRVRRGAPRNVFCTRKNGLVAPPD